MNEWSPGESVELYAELKELLERKETSSADIERKYPKLSKFRKELKQVAEQEREDGRTSAGS